VARNPLRVLVVEDRRSDRFIARQLLGNFDLDFTWQRVTSTSELRAIAQDFNPNLVFCADQLTVNSRSAALDMLRMLALRTAVIHVAEVDDMDETAERELATPESTPAGAPPPSTASQPPAADAAQTNSPSAVGATQTNSPPAAAAAVQANSPPAAHWRKSLPSLLDTSADLVAISDSSGWITYANASASQLLGEPCKQSIGTAFGPAHEFASSERGPHRLALFDASGQPNPLHLSDLVKRIMTRTRDDRTALPIVALDLKGLRMINEISGCAMSDEVLNVVGSELKSRAVECGMIARVGDDDILVVLPDTSSPSDAAVNVHNNRRLSGAAEKPAAAAAPAPTSAEAAPAAPAPISAEAAPAAPASISAEAVPAAPAPISAEAVPAAPASISAEAVPAAPPRPPVEAGLDDALQRHATSVHYQPQFELQNGRGCGVEALARWILSSGESMAPAVFIPIAERAGMIDILGARVLQSACNTAAAWRGSEAERLTVSVKVSALQINGKFFRTLVGILETSGLQASRLELELAETAIIANAELAARCLKQWKERGVRIAVSHAGTNYSSLSYLSRLPVDRLKLDKSLVHTMSPGSKGAAAVHALICLGAELGIDVIAEGVETEPQFQMLQELGCLQIQGYLLGRPMAAVQAQIALRKPWGNLPKSVLRPQPAIRERYAS
jgi:EAL domain-containing protein (putative c-di-GMP-specific phosphodiesterase class I)/GGDEF domain-containing protein